MMIDSARRITALVRHNTVLRVRDPGHMVSYLVMPMLLMLVFSPVHRAALPEGGQEQAVLGMLVMFSVLSLTVVGTALLGERVWRTWNRLRVTPATTAELLVGTVLPVFVLLVAQQGLLLSFGARFVGMPVAGSPLLLASAICVWSFALLAIGCALGGFVRSHGELSAISDVGALAVSVLGGALAPLVLMPSWAQALAPLSPGYWAMGLFGAAVSGDPAGFLRPALVLILLGAAASVVACVRVARGLPELRG